MSWQAYVDDHLMCQLPSGGQLQHAAIWGQDGGVWAQVGAGRAAAAALMPPARHPRAARCTPGAAGRRAGRNVAPLATIPACCRSR